MRTPKRAVILLMITMTGCAHSHKRITPPTTMSMATTRMTKPSTKPVAQAPRTQSAATTKQYAVTQPATMPMQATSEPATQEATAQPQAPAFHPAPPTTDPAAMEADAALAEHLATMAQALLPTKVQSNDLWKPIFQQMAAILTAANKLDPTNARICRLTLIAMQELRDEDGVIDSLNAIRKADPADQFAQIELLDLYTSRMETADAKLAYLQQVMSRTMSVPAPVRSHAAVASAQLMLERGETQTAMKLLNQALVLNPISGEALRMHYNLLPPNASTYERVEGLLALMKSNPAQPNYAEQLGDQLAGAGLVEESLPWFKAALAMTSATGMADLNAARSYATEMLLDGRIDEAAGVATQLIKVEPDNPDNWFLNLAIFRFGGAKDNYTKTLQQAANVMSNRLVDVINKIAAPGVEKATTRPITMEAPLTLPDMSLTVAYLNQSGDAQKKEMFVDALSDMAMIEVYFAQQADAASHLVDAMSAILPADSPRLVRLSGWSDLVAGRIDQARTKLSSIAASDVLAELGIVKLTAMNPADQHKAANAGRQLISQHPSGFWAAIIWDGLKGLDVRIVTSGQADLVKDQLNSLPKDWLNVIDHPQQFYGVHIEPVNVARRYGEPLLATVMIQNLTDNDLTIGPDGIIKRDFWMNASVHGATDKTMGVGNEQIAGPVMLPARQHCSQIIRLDQGQLLSQIDSDPTVLMEIYGTVETNPINSSNGALVPGPAGYAVEFTSVFSRLAAPPGGDEAVQAMTDLDGGTSAQKIRAIQLLAKYIQIIAAAKDANDQAKGYQAICYHQLEKACNDASPTVSAWANYVIGAMADSTRRAVLLREMSDDVDWRHRLMALVLANSTDLTVHKEIAMKLSADPEPSVRSLANSSLALVEVAATLPPSTEPSTTQPSMIAPPATEP